MNIRLYNRPLQFYLLSTIIPWAFWFIAAYFSHSLPDEKSWISSIFGFVGLLSPFVIAMAMMSKNKALYHDFVNRLFNLKNVKIKYILVALFLMLISILLAQLVSLVFGYSTNQFQITGKYTFTSGVFPVWFLLTRIIHKF